jgi:hypothetical protein
MAKKLSLSDTRAALEAIDVALEALSAAPPAAFEYVDDRYLFHKTILGQARDRLDKATDVLMKDLRVLEKEACRNRSTSPRS